MAYGHYQSPPGSTYGIARRDTATGSSRERSSASTKIVISGGFGAGKTTFVGTVSEIMPLRTEALVTNASQGLDGLDATPEKNTTTVAMDFGRITLAEDLVLYLFGTPGQRRFWFMWDDLVRGAIGAIILVDVRRLQDSFAAVDFFEARQSAVPHRRQRVRRRPQASAARGAQGAGPRRPHPGGHRRCARPAFGAGGADRGHRVRADEPQSAARLTRGRHRREVGGPGVRRARLPRRGSQPAAHRTRGVHRVRLLRGRPVRVRASRLGLPQLQVHAGRR